MTSYLFDVDGTLTYPRQKMKDNHIVPFLSWMSDKGVFIVAGSDREKVLEQLPASILARCSGVFCCMGNELWDKDHLVYRNEWKPPIELVADLVNIYLDSPYPKAKRALDYFEERSGMLNFTIVGRKATAEQRADYASWDTQEQERRDIVNILSNKYSDLDFKIGGQVSIDIQPKGANKAQASQWVRKYISKDIFS